MILLTLSSIPDQFILNLNTTVLMKTFMVYLHEWIYKNMTWKLHKVLLNGVGNVTPRDEHESHTRAVLTGWWVGNPQHEKNLESYSVSVISGSGSSILPEEVNHAALKALGRRSWF